MKSTSSNVVRGVLIGIGVIVALLLLGRFTVASFFQMEGHSMLNTLQDKQFLLVNKLDTTPARGDIIVFKAPFDEDGAMYLKRVIGLPGETIVIKDGYVVLYGDGQYTPLNEPYIEDMFGSTYGYSPNDGNVAERIFEVPDGAYLVLGDNRMNSMDSRSFADGYGDEAPYIPTADIVGTVWWY